MRRKLIFALAAVLLLTPWPVAYAYENASGGPEPVRIEAAQPAASPAWRAYGGAIGGVTTPTPLFYIDSANSTADIQASLYLTNSDELIHHYRYMILKVGVYWQTGADRWEKAGSGGTLPDTYITMQNGRVDLALPGYARYKVSIDGGSFYAYRATSDAESASPKFYLTAR